MTGLREQKKARTRRAIQEHALRLFLANGYDATTVEEIAAAAGVSHMTFFRYFPNKPAVVENDDYDPAIAEAIRSRPAAEPPLTAIRRALTLALTHLPPTERETVRTRARLILSVPALRSRQVESQRTTRDLFATAIENRGPASPLQRRALAAAAVSALSVALEQWATGPDDNLAALVDEAFAALVP